MAVAAVEITRFATIPVLAAPSFPLAANLIVQKGITAASKVKYAKMSFMLNHKPYSSGVVFRAIIN